MTGRRVKQFKFVTDFHCITDKCEDHCCGAWRVSINNATRELYEDESPELSEYVEEDDQGYKIKKNPATGMCSQLKEGLCSIHKNYSENFLPDTCTFYPRTFREIGEETIVTATTSCPEVARLIIESDDPFKLEEQDVDRIPEEVHDYKMNDEDEDNVFLIIQRIIEESQRDDIYAEEALTRIIAVCKVLDTYQPDAWAEVVDNLFDISKHNAVKRYDERISMFNIVQFFVEIRKNKPKRWLDMFEKIESSFRVRIPKDHDNDDDDDGLKAETILNKKLIDNLYDNEESIHKMDIVLKRFLGAELVRNIFPYAGISGSLEEKIIPIAMSFCFLRIAIIAYSEENGTLPSNQQIVTIIQTLSRGTNHLSVDVLEFFQEKGIRSENALHQIINNP